MAAVRHVLFPEAYQTCHANTLTLHMKKLQLTGVTFKKFTEQGMERTKQVTGWHS